uniref:Uncharacterized protein n=1 Tax=viral metagenome TaxID=1070528 RepID=A0A6C0JQ70_9ZZZZ
MKDALYIGCLQCFNGLVECVKAINATIGFQMCFLSDLFVEQMITNTTCFDALNCSGCWNLRLMSIAKNCTESILNIKLE